LSALTNVSSSSYIDSLLLLFFTRIIVTVYLTIVV
jgi:hypothetical protein